MTRRAAIRRARPERGALSEEELRQVPRSFSCSCRPSVLRNLMLDPQGNIATWKRGAQRIKQYAPSEIIGRHFSTFYTRRTSKTGSRSAS